MNFSMSRAVRAAAVQVVSTLLFLQVAACGDGPTAANGIAPQSSRLERDGVAVRLARGDEVTQTAAYDVSNTGYARHVGLFLSRNAGDVLALLEVEIRDVDGNNVALGKTAIHPSSEEGYGPENANDGDPTTAAVTRDPTLWWYVDLEKDHEIHSIVVTLPSDACCDGSLDDIRVATSSDGFESDRVRINLVDTDVPAEDSRAVPSFNGSVQSDSSSATCDESDADSTSTDPKGFTCETDDKVKFQGLASGTIYYTCTDTSGGFSDFFYTSDVTQDVSGSLTCWTGTYHLCMELLDSGYDECSMFCSNLTFNTHSVEITEIECEWGY